MTHCNLAPPPGNGSRGHRGGEAIWVDDQLKAGFQTGVCEDRLLDAIDVETESAATRSSYRASSVSGSKTPVGTVRGFA